MAEITIEVTDQDIATATLARDHAELYRPSVSCPIGQALTRMGHRGNDVGYARIITNYTSYLTGKQESDFMRDFDGGLPVEPSTFVLIEGKLKDDYQP